MVDVILPDVGEGVTEGEIVRWHVKEGDKVSKYQTLVEIMTVKVLIELPSPATGLLTKILAGDGKVVKVGEPIATVEPEEAARESGVPVEVREIERPVTAEPAPVLATPAVRRLGGELGVDLAKVSGTGPEGRVTEEDVRRATEGAAQPLVTRIQLKGMRRMIAEKLVTSRSRGAHVTIFEEVDATGLMKLREASRTAADQRGVKLTYLPFMMKAVVSALREYPMLNSTVDDEKGEIVVHHAHNLGVAVDTEHGLLVPVVRDMDQKEVLDLAMEMEGLAGRAREGRLDVKDVQGGTFSITNYGAVGGLSGTPIVNYPEVAILGLGRIESRPVALEGKVDVRPMMTLAMTFDHRVIDGAYATRFLLSLKKRLQEIESSAAR